MMSQRLRSAGRCIGQQDDTAVDGQRTLRHRSPHRSKRMPGTIYLVGTPLGNLEDITLRALRILREADVIACEDTRRSRKLLDHFEIHKPLLSYHEHNEEASAKGLAARAQAGDDIAIISDAGMPGISDPGFRVVQEAIRAGITIVPIPGPVAVETALVVSGLPTDSFRFEGFLPGRKSQRRKALAEFAAETVTLVFYEAPHRIEAALADIVEILGDRPVVVAREMTKLHEEFVRGTASGVLAELQAKNHARGEITLLIGRAEAAKPADKPIQERFAELVEEGAGRMEAIKQAAKEYEIPKSEAYRLVDKERSSG